jgi:hypothetical protein
MYNQHEKSVLRQQFWTAFGQYMTPVPSSEGIKINWVNYKTGVKDLYFKMEAGAGIADISILITHTDPSRQSLFFNLFKQLRNHLQTVLQEEWQWVQETEAENGKTISRIYSAISGVSIYNKEDWPQIISFLKPRIIALDAFWNEVKFGFGI